MDNNKKKPVLYIYFSLLVFIICSFIFPIYEFKFLVLALFLSISTYILLIYFKNKSNNKITDNNKESNDEVFAENSDPRVQSIIKDGRLAVKEYARLYNTISDQNIKDKINDLMKLTDEIVNDSIEDPTDVTKIKQFMNYYQPTTLKLINAYDRMSSQEFIGDNISKSIENITEMLDTTVKAYTKFLDSLFENQALDIETDIEVMNKLLEREGLIE